MANEQNLRTPDTNTAREMQKKSIKKPMKTALKYQINCPMKKLKESLETGKKTMV